MSAPDLTTAIRQVAQGVFCGQPFCCVKLRMATRALGTHEHPRLLVVEDDPDVRLFMVLALRQEGYEVHSAPDAREALRLLREDHFDLVLTDYGLPGKDGLALVSEAERTGLLRGTKVMMLTAFPWLAREATMPVLSKPIDFDELADHLRLMLKGVGA